MRTGFDSFYILFFKSLSQMTSWWRSSTTIGWQSLLTYWITTTQFRESNKTKFQKWSENIIWVASQSMHPPEPNSFNSSAIVCLLLTVPKPQDWWPNTWRVQCGSTTSATEVLIAWVSQWVTPTLIWVYKDIRFLLVFLKKFKSQVLIRDLYSRCQSRWWCLLCGGHPICSSRYNSQRQRDAKRTDRSLGIFCKYKGSKSANWLANVESKN